MSLGSDRYEKAWLTRGQRATYERNRRNRVIQESRDYRAISGWLTTLYPDIMTAFLAFKNNMERENPWRKDLTTSPTFKAFLREKTGM